LDAGADINMVVSEDEDTILHTAAATMHTSPVIITALIEAGSNIQALDKRGRTALHRAVIYDGPSRLAIVELLLKHSAATTCQGEGNTILEDLVCHAGFPVHLHTTEVTTLFAMLLSRGACINNPNPVAGPSALALLIKNDMPFELIKLALEAGADVNAPPVLTGGLYPIQEAARAGNLPMLMELLRRGANINAPAASRFGRTALQSACLLKGGGPLVRDLLALGADVNAAAAYDSGFTALQAAAMSGQIDVAQMLIEHGAQLDLPPATMYGYIPLDGAARMGKIDMVQYLMNLGAISQKPGTTRYDGAIKLAETEGHFSIADLMREHASRLDEEQSWWVDCLDDDALDGFFAAISQPSRS
jgi:ankyrin repeat protein